MRLLFVASRFPYPPLNGDQVRGYHHVRLLSRRHEVVLLAPAPAGDPAAQEAAIRELRRYCVHVETVPTGHRTRMLRLPRALVDPRPLQTLLFHDARLDAAARDLCARFAFDLVHVQMIRTSPVVAALPARLPRVLDLIDSIGLNMRRRADRTRPPLSWLARWEGGRAARYERQMADVFDQLTISSPLDRAAIGAPDNLHVVANGVDVDAHAFSAAERESDSLAFTGTMWYFPNVDAAQWLVHRVLPLVRREIPRVRLAIIGSRPSRSVRALADEPGVTVTGHVASVHEHIARAAVAVAPMQSGSGIQFKIIEAMSAGTPVVATPVAVRGLVAEHDRDLVVAESPEAFAAAIVRLLRDADTRARLARAGRSLVEAHYSWERTVEDLEQVYALARGARRHDGATRGGNGVAVGQPT